MAIFSYLKNVFLLSNVTGASSVTRYAETAISINKIITGTYVCACTRISLINNWSVMLSTIQKYFLTILTLISPYTCFKSIPNLKMRARIFSLKQASFQGSPLQRS